MKKTTKKPVNEAKKTLIKTIVKPNYAKNRLAQIEEQISSVQQQADRKISELKGAANGVLLTLLDAEGYGDTSKYRIETTTKNDKIEIYELE